MVTSYIMDGSNVTEDKPRAVSSMVETHGHQAKKD